MKKKKKYKKNIIARKENVGFEWPYVDNHLLVIEDNCLDQEKFDELQTFMMGKLFPWTYNDTIEYEGQKDRFMFNHIFYIDGLPSSPICEKMEPIIKKLNVFALARIKANLLTRTPNIVEGEFHIDIGGISSEEKLKQWTTSIFYMNTNNGYTIFEDGAKVESVANRMITFPANVKHKGTSCSDEKTRVNINFNYFK